MQSYKNRAVLITGASMGIGEAFARELAGRGANLILTARSEQKLVRLAEELRTSSGVEVHIFPADLTEKEAPSQLAHKIADAGLKVDVLINNAGFGKWGLFSHYELAIQEQMIALNLRALTSLTYLFLPGMLERGDGGVLNVASTAAFQPTPYFSVYGATKAYVLNFSEALWHEAKKHGVKVTCLCPGPTKSNFHETSKIDPEKLVALESSAIVARRGLEALLRGKPVAISGWMNSVLAKLPRFLPRSVVTRVTARVLAPT